jgi:hypothetical protein
MAERAWIFAVSALAITTVAGSFRSSDKVDQIACGGATIAIDPMCERY